MANTDIESVLTERRKFPPPAAFAQRALIKTEAEYQALYRESMENPDLFWSKMAGELDWFRKFDQVLDWSKAPFAKWFVGGKINISYNCLDRHVLSDRKSKAALIWEGEPGDSRTFTYAQLHREVCKFTNVLKNLGIKTGDRIAIYMPMIPEAAIAMLACARLGAPHTVVFGGFSAEALSDRINDAQATAVITADGGWRRGEIIELKKNVDLALQKPPASNTASPSNAPAQEIAMVSDAEKAAQAQVDQITQYIKDNKLDSADKALTALEENKASLPASIQTKLPELRTALNAAKAMSAPKAP